MNKILISVRNALAYFYVCTKMFAKFTRPWLSSFLFYL